MKNQTNDSEAIMESAKKEQRAAHGSHYNTFDSCHSQVRRHCPFLICNMIKLKMWRVHMNTILVVFEKYKRNDELKNKGINFRKVGFQLS